MKNIEKVNQICKRHLNVDFLKDAELRKKHFFSKEVGASVRELVLVLLEIEKELEYTFSDEYLKSGGFGSFDMIVDYMGLENK